MILYSTKIKHLQELSRNNECGKDNNWLLCHFGVQLESGKLRFAEKWSEQFEKPDRILEKENWHH